MDKEAFLKQYTHGFSKQQIQAVTTVDGPVLLLAVPGSGKTTVLIARLGYMIYVRNIDPRSIVVITYTNAAADEMKARFARQFTEALADKITFKTINALCNMIIRTYSERVSHNQVFDLAKDDQTTKLLRKIYADYTKEYATDSILKEIRTGITYVKNMMLDENEIKDMKFSFDHFDLIYNAYLDEMKKHKWMDYDDQLVYARLFLMKVPALLKYYQQRYQYFCMDESQDTSRIQHEILHLLAEKSQNVFLVGDEDQSIYGFRAAYPQALLDFEKNWPDAKVLLMEENYRSTGNIISAASDFISRNQFRHPKNIKAVRKEGEQIHVIEVSDRSDQYTWLLDQAKEKKNKFAVLYRNNDSAIPLVDLLYKNEISFQMRSNDALFFSSRIVNDIRDIVTFAYFPDNLEIFQRIYYKFSLQISKKMAAAAMEKCSASGNTILFELVNGQDLPGWMKAKVVNLSKQFKKLKEISGSSLIDFITEEMAYSDYAEHQNLDLSKLDILKQIASSQKDGLTFLNRLDELENLIKNHQNSKDANLILSTIHSAKGLEYDQVYLLDVIDGILPLNSDDIQIQQEERRLFYVGMTRAKNSLYLFHIGNERQSFTNEIISRLPKEVMPSDDIFAALTRNLIGRTYIDASGHKAVIIGQCGDEILLKYPQHKYALTNLADMLRNRRHVYAKEEQQKKQKITSKHNRQITNLAPGMHIKHKKYGLGRVNRILDGNAYIAFEDETRIFKIITLFDKHLIEIVDDETWY
ncbi:MAG: ATP-dependent helicase [Lactimicrobium sp.]|jgi:superfamily I DNA/RNA helicase|uniref:ATP-dependent helicase n=1 Tax=Lactimicrobium sp. TaxID=2563780 RepID=UPI002F357ABC